MDTEKDVLALLRRVEAGEMKPEDALLQLKLEPYEDIGFAKADMPTGVVLMTTSASAWRSRFA